MNVTLLRTDATNGKSLFIIFIYFQMENKNIITILNSLI